LTERRKFLRFDTALNALCEIVTEKLKSPSKIRNISKEGALIVVDKPLREGEELNLTMDVPGDNVPIFASCQLRGKGAWKEPIATARTRPGKVHQD